MAVRNKRDSKGSTLQNLAAKMFELDRAFLIQEFDRENDTHVMKTIIHKIHSRYSWKDVVDCFMKNNLLQVVECIRNIRELEICLEACDDNDQRLVIMDHIPSSLSDIKNMDVIDKIVQLTGDHPASNEALMSINKTKNLITRLFYRWVTSETHFNKFVYKSGACFLGGPPNTSRMYNQELIRVTNVPWAIRMFQTKVPFTLDINGRGKVRMGELADYVLDNNPKHSSIGRTKDYILDWIENEIVNWKRGDGSIDIALMDERVAKLYVKNIRACRQLVKKYGEHLPMARMTVTL